MVAVVGVARVAVAVAAMSVPHIGFQVNSTNQRTVYMRFIRKMTSKKVKSLAPELVERFQNKAARGDLFSDFFKADGSVESMKMLHKRRHVDQQKSQKKFRPLTQKMLEEKYDAEYVKTLIQDAVANNRWKPDDLMPWDQERIKYYVLDDESIEFNQMFEQETSLSGAADITSEQAAAFTSAGGAFDSLAGHTGMPGFDGSAFAHAMTNSTAVVEVPKGGRGKKNGKPLGGDDGADGVEVVAVVQPLEVQQKNCTHLTKLSGAACEMILKLKAMPENAEGWIKSLECSKEEMEQLYGELSAMTGRKVNDEEVYVPFQERFDAVVEEYNNRKQFVNAFLNVRKRQEQASS